jgi:hypothetical protein
VWIAETIRPICPRNCAYKGRGTGTRSVTESGGSEWSHRHAIGSLDPFADYLYAGFLISVVPDGATKAGSGSSKLILLANPLANPGTQWELGGLGLFGD